jgi:hypothetical protein
MTLKPAKAHVDYLLAGVAFFVSLTTLGVYIYQARMMREQQHVSVWPYMEWNTSNVQDYHLSTRNKGVGPAIIRKVEMSVDGKPVASNRALIDAILGPGADLTHINSSLEGRVLLPGEEVVPFRVPDLPAGRAFEAKLQQHAFQLRITYCSVYGECWVTDGDRAQRLPDVRLGLF